MNVVNAATVNATTLVGVGANAQVNTTAFFVGNATVNTVITSTNIGGSSNAQLNVVNAASINATSTLGVGANVAISTSQISVGNATVNTTITATNIGGFSNAQFNIVNAATISTISLVSVGANVSVNTTAFFVGNSSVNTSITSTGIDTDGVLLVQGNTTLSSNLTVAGAASIGGGVTLQTEYVIDVTANGNIGTTAAPRLIYSFPKATYRTGKLMVQASRTGNNQIAEMIIAHDGTDSFLTVYGTVASPAGSNTSAPLRTFTTSINNANVEVFMAQTANNTAVKVIAHLIK